jgi:hypothetical protein
LTLESLPPAGTPRIAELLQAALDERQLASANAARRNGFLCEARITGLLDRRRNARR